MIIEDLCSDLDMRISMVSHDTNKGYKESIQTGVKNCNNPYLFLINSDTVVTHNFAYKLVDVMRKDKRFRAVAPISNHPTDLYQFRKRLYLKRHFDDDDHHAIIDRFEPLVKKNGIFKRWFSNNITIAPYLSANCLALDREVFERVGHLHNGYDHGYFEDLDLCCSIRNLGYKLAIKEDCFVFHRGQGSYKDKSREEKEKQIWKNFYIFESRWSNLPEHEDLVKRMNWAGTECPI
jgi:GT2 family glycosyltransferase